MITSRNRLKWATDKALRGSWEKSNLADYVIELATRSFQQIQENSLTGREIAVVIEEPPADAASLSAKLDSLTAKARANSAAFQIWP